MLRYSAVSAILVAFLLLLAPIAKSQESAPVKELILPGDAFLVEGRAAFVLHPSKEKRTKPQPWILYAPTLPGLPDRHEKWMHEQFLAAGVAVAGIDIGESYGNPQGQKWMTSLYDELTKKRGFAKRPCLLGRSRGGLMVSSWAIAHPGKISGIAGIYPVFDLRSYPGLPRAAKAYGMTTQDLVAQLAQHNPVARVDVLAKHKVPVWIIHGNSDKVVPLEANSGAVADCFRQSDAAELITLTVAEKQGHNFWEGFFRCQPLIDFAIQRAKAGAE